MARLKIFSSRSKGANFDVYEDIDRISEFRVDGLMNLMIGPSDAKLVFYTTRTIEQPDASSSGEPFEIRDINLKLSIPTRALLESCLNILNNVKVNESTMIKAHQDEEKKIRDVLNKIQQVVDKKHQH